VTPDEAQRRHQTEKELETVLRETNVSEERIKQLLSKKSESSEYCEPQLELDDGLLNAVEYIPVETDGAVKERE